MAIKFIVELQAKAGKRDEVARAIENLVSQFGPDMPGYLGSTRYEVPDNPDMLSEIADWETAEVRDAHPRVAAKKCLFAPLADLLAAPFRSLSSDRCSKAPWLVLLFPMSC